MHGAAGHTPEGIRRPKQAEAGGPAGGREMVAGTHRAARDGITRGLRALYSDVVDSPLPDEMRALLDRLSGPPL